MLWSFRKCKKNEVWRRLGCVVTKNIFAQTIRDKIFGIKYRNHLKLHRARKIWYLLLHVFDCYCLSLISGKEIRHCAMSSPKLEFFPVFPNFARSSVRQLVRQLVMQLTRLCYFLRQLLYQFCYTSYKSCFTCGNLSMN